MGVLQILSRDCGFAATSEKRDVNLELLEEGAAWHYEEYDHNKRLREAEQAARAAKKGLWTDAHPIPPWEWRKTEKERKR